MHTQESCSVSCWVPVERLPSQHFNYRMLPTSPSHVVIAVHRRWFATLCVTEADVMLCLQSEFARRMEKGEHDFKYKVDQVQETLSDAHKAHLRQVSPWLCLCLSGVLICPLVVLICPLVVLIRPLVVLIRPLAVLICPLAVLVCPLCTIPACWQSPSALCEPSCF